MKFNKFIINFFETNAGKFIAKEMIFDGNTIIEKKIDAAAKSIKVVYIGKGVSPDLALFPAVDENSFTRALLSSKRDKTPDTVNLVYLKFSRQVKNYEIRRMENWLRERMKGEKIKIVVTK